MQQTDDLRIRGIHEVEPPAVLHERHPITEQAAQTVFETRALNEWFEKVYAFLSWSDYIWYQESHRRHHMTTCFHGADGEIVQQIIELLDTRVRPAVAQDGGDITFHGFENGVDFLTMRGACAGCPSSTMTLKSGIENLLRHYIPEVTEVRPVGL